LRCVNEKLKKSDRDDIISKVQSLKWTPHISICLRSLTNWFTMDPTPAPQTLPSSVFFLYQNQIPRLKTLFIFLLFFDKFFFFSLIPLLFCFLCTRKYIPRANAQNSEPRKARGIFFVWIIYHPFPFPFLFLIFGLSFVCKINHFV
jgi:hypothetical protein